VLFLGLDGAGKSSVLNALKPERERARATPPTSAPLTERVIVRTKHGAHKFKATDLPGGQHAAVTLWPQHFAGAQAVVWVVDASDALRAQAAQDALDRRAVSLPARSAPRRLTARAASQSGVAPGPGWCAAPRAGQQNARAGRTYREAGAQRHRCAAVHPCEPLLTWRMRATQVEEALELERMPGGAREWHVCACSATTGEGVQAGCEWLVAAVARAPPRSLAPVALHWQ
jgi:hypothetical protein